MLFNAAFSGALGAAFAGAGYGFSKAFGSLLKNSSWLSKAKELFRIGKISNHNSGGTLFKIGKTFRIDFEAGKQLFHTHITYNLYNSMPKFIKSMKWIFDPAKRDVHVRLTSILGGVIGVTQKE